MLLKSTLEGDETVMRIIQHCYSLTSLFDPSSCHDVDNVLLYKTTLKVTEVTAALWVFQNKKLAVPCVIQCYIKNGRRAQYVCQYDLSNINYAMNDSDPGIVT